MKFILPILLLFLTCFSSSATTVYPKVALPNDAVSFSKIENQKLESEVKIGVSNFARSGISEAKQLHPKFKSISISLTAFYFSRDNENAVVLNSAKSFSKSHLYGFTFSKQEELFLLENRARDGLSDVVNTAPVGAKLKQSISMGLRANN